MAVEILTFAIGVSFVALAAWAGFMAGREAAERQAFYTIANLRRTLSSQRIELDRAAERNRQLMRHVNTARQVDVEVPEWMQ